MPDLKLWQQKIQDMARSGMTNVTIQAELGLGRDGVAKWAKLGRKQVKI